MDSLWDGKKYQDSSIMTGNGYLRTFNFFVTRVVLQRRDLSRNDLHSENKTGVTKLIATDYRALSTGMQKIATIFD